MECDIILWGKIMIEIKDAIVKSKVFISEVYDQSDELLLDSAKSDGNKWLVTFRVPLIIKPINNMQQLIGMNKRIFYKTVIIDETGSIIEIKDEDLPNSQAQEILAEAI